MRASIRELPLRTAHPFVIARGGGSEYTSIVCILEAGGLTGAGEGSPSQYYGETPAVTRAALAAILAALPLDGIESLDPGRVDALLAEAATIIGRNGAAHAALDGALWDLCGKQAGKPVWELLGLTAPGPMETSFTIAIASPDAMLARAREAVAAGFTVLKLKVGWEGDLDVVERVIAETGARVRVDANAAWTAGEALAKAERLALAGVELLEQPLAWDDLAGLRRLAGRCPLPLVLDESIRGPWAVDVFGEYADGVNLKVSKLGGLRACLATASRAEAAGLQLMMGCMIESSLGIAQGLQLASLLRWADLDGALLLESDPHAGPRREGAAIRLGDGPGLGVTRRTA